MLLQQQKQSCNSKWWHFNTHIVSVLALEKRDVSHSIPVLTICFCMILRCVLRQIAFALFSSLFFRLSLSSSRRKCSNKKVSRFLLVLSPWFRWWQLQPLKSTTTWTTFSKVNEVAMQLFVVNKSVLNVWEIWKERHWFQKVFCYEFMKQKKRGRGQKSMLSRGLVVLQVHERITVKSGRLILPDASFALNVR